MAAAGMVDLFGIGSLPFAVGLYLPIHLTAPIMVGGIIKGIITKLTKNKEEQQAKNERGILLSSVYIAGEALTGVAIALLISAGVTLPTDTIYGPIVSMLAIAAVAVLLLVTANKKIQNN